MKKGLMALAIVLAGTLVQARTIVCKDLESGKVVVSLTDDMGSIVNGWFSIRGLINEFSPQERLISYNYYYGEYLTIKEVNYDQDVIEVLAVRIPGSVEFAGFFHYYDPSEQQTYYAAKLTCKE